MIKYKHTNKNYASVKMKKTALRIGFAILILLLSLITAGCKNNKECEKHGNENYFEVDEIYGKYVEIKNALENEDNLSKADVIDVCNTYKKIFASISFINYSRTDDSELPYVLDVLPDMPGLHTDMPEKLTNLLLKHEAVKITKTGAEFHKASIVENYLTSTDSCPLENVVIIRELDTDSDYCYHVLSKDGNFFFTVFISTEYEKTVYISPNQKLEHAEYIAQKGISLTDVEKEIPEIDSSLINTDK